MDNNNEYWKRGAAEKDKNLFSTTSLDFWYEVQAIKDATLLLDKLCEEESRIIYKQPRRDYQSCLDYGCGLGRVLKYLAGVFPESDGFDPNNEKFNKLPDRSYDFIYSMGVLKHNVVLDQVFILEWCFDHLNPGGIMIIDIPICGDWLEGEPRGEVFPLKLVNVLFRDKKNCIMRFTPHNIDTHFFILKKF